MRTWAHWTAQTVVVTAGVVAAGAGFSGVAFAAHAPSRSGPACRKRTISNIWIRLINHELTFGW